MEGTFLCLDHVVVAVADLDAATRGYATLLGRGPSWRGEHPGAGTANTLFRLENTYLELLAPTADVGVGTVVGRRLEERGEGPFALAFGTDRAEACRARLAAAGLGPGEVRKGMGRDAESGAFREWLHVLLPPARTRGVPIFAIEHRSPPELLPTIGPAGDPAAAVHALDHVVVASSDGDASRALFGDALGLRLALDRTFERFGFRGLFFRVGGVTVEVSARLDAGDADPSTDALWGIAWRVDDVGSARARLAASAFDVSEVRPGRKPGTDVFTVRSPTCGVATLVLGPGAAT